MYTIWFPTKKNQYEYKAIHVAQIIKGDSDYQNNVKKWQTQQTEIPSKIESHTLLLLRRLDQWQGKYVQPGKQLSTSLLRGFMIYSKNPYLFIILCKKKTLLFLRSQSLPRRKPLRNILAFLHISAKDIGLWKKENTLVELRHERIPPLSSTFNHEENKCCFIINIKVFLSWRCQLYKL